MPTLPGPGELGGPGIPGRVRVTEGQLTSRAIMETDNFNRFIKTVERSNQQIMEKLVNDMEKRARAYAPKRTGRLRRSIHGVLLNNGREGRVTSTVPYAEFQERGTRPHRIHGVKASFEFDNGTQYFVWNHPKFGPVGRTAKGKRTSKGYQNWTAAYGATVNHPGHKGQWFFRRSFNEVFPTARGIMRTVYARESRRA